MLLWLAKRKFRFDIVDQKRSVIRKCKYEYTDVYIRYNTGLSMLPCVILKSMVQ